MHFFNILSKYYLGDTRGIPWYRKDAYFVAINNKSNFYRWISLKQQEKIVIFVL